jgi:nicotinamidase/pyrazinamidase
MKTNNTTKEFSAKDTIFYMVDMEDDFVNPSGALYVSGAEKLVPVIQKLQGHARAHAIRECASVDRHFYSDEEISNTPNWSKTFPPHCMNGTPGQRIISELTLDDIQYHGDKAKRIEDKWSESGARAMYKLSDLLPILQNTKPIIFEKQSTDVTTNPYFKIAMDYLKSEGVKNVVVYGVATDYCVKDAVTGLLANGLDVYLVEDAITGINPENCKKTLDDFVNREDKKVKLVSSTQILQN